MPRTTRGALGVGLIGAGRWARVAHAPAYTKPNRARLVAVCDTDRSRAQTLAVHMAVADVYTDYRDLLADSAVDVVDVCTTSETHAEISRAAVAAGKHVLCEKPLAECSADAFSAAAQALARSVRTKLGFAFRHAPALRRLHAWISDGTLGDIVHVHALQLDSHLPDPEFALRHIPPDAPRDRLLPSSIVAYGSTVVDLMRWCGGNFRAVCASMRASGDDPAHGVEDRTAAIVEFASGAQGLLQTSYVAHGNGPGIEVRVYGSKRSAIARLIWEHGRSETLAMTGAGGEWTFAEPDLCLYPPGTNAATPWPFVCAASWTRSSTMVRPSARFSTAQRADRSSTHSCARSTSAVGSHSLRDKSFLALADELLTWNIARCD